METEIKVLRSLLESRAEKGHTIVEISARTGSDYKIVHTAIERLAGKGLLAKRRVGKSIEVSLHDKFSEEIFEAEMERREEVLKSKDMKVMLNTIKENMGTALFTLLLFGSHAKKAATKHSDIDLMLIVPDKSGLEKKAESVLSLIPLPLHPLIFTESQFRSMKNSREPSVVSEAITHNIILYGIEQYYEMIK